MNNEKLKEIIEETTENNDSNFNEIVLNIVKKIIDLPENAETTISKLISNEIDNKTMFEIDESVTKVCKKININLDKSKHAGQFIGLPFNISFIKKTLSDNIINEIPEPLKEYIYIHNGNIYAKQKIPKELEEEFEILTQKINK